MSNCSSCSRWVISHPPSSALSVIHETRCRLRRAYARPDLTSSSTWNCCKLDSTSSTLLRGSLSSIPPPRLPPTTSPSHLIDYIHSLPTCLANAQRDRTRGEHIRRGMRDRLRRAAHRAQGAAGPARDAYAQGGWHVLDSEFYGWECLNDWFA
mgnify:CR=1 FL=1